MPNRSDKASMPNAYRGREQAYIKHRLLENYLAKLFHIVGLSASEIGIKELAYVDCFAGPWGDESDSLDSTSIAISLRVLSKCRETLEKLNIRLSFRALYIEKNPKAFGRLKKYLKDRVADGVDAEALEGDFAELIPSILEWADRNTFSFFFIDPTAWRPVSVNILRPLLERPQSEFLINFMYDFANRAISMADQQKQTTELIGEEPNVGSLHGREREKSLLGAYRRNLMRLVPVAEPWRARSAYVRVLDSTKDRPKYHLVYLTTHPRGLVEFMLAAQKIDLIQKRVRAATKQQLREEKTKIDQLFADADLVQADDGHIDLEVVEEYWRKTLTDEPKLFGYAEFADMLEDVEWFPVDFQRALGNLMERGQVRNLDATNKRRSQFLHLEKNGERLQLTGKHL